MSLRHKTTAFILLLAAPFSALALERIELLPPTAQSYLRISNAPDFFTQLKKSSVGKLWADQQFQDFIGNPEDDVWQELFLTQGSEEENRVFTEQLKMLKGEIIMATDMTTDKPFIIAAMSDAEFQRSLELDEKIKDTASTPFEIIKGIFQDVEVVQYIENAGTPQAYSSWQTHLKGTLLFGYSEEWIERNIIRLKKESPAEPEGPPALTLNIQLSRLVRDILLESMKTEQLATMFSPEALLDALGLLDIENFLMKIELKDNQMLIDNTLRTQELKKGIFSILDLRPTRMPMVDFVPEDITAIEVGRINLLQFWQEIPVALSTVMPVLAPEYNIVIDMLQQQAGIHFENDLLSYLGTQYISYTKNDANDQNSVIALELNNAMAFQNGLQTVLTAPALQLDQSIDTQDFLDHSLYVMEDVDPELPMAFCVAADHLLYGPADSLRQVIRTQSGTSQSTPPLENMPLVKKLLNHVPPTAYGYSAIDWKKNMDQIVQMLNQPGSSQVIQQSWAKTGAALPPPDFSKLPPADHIASFFNMTYQYTEAAQGGLHQRIILNY